MGQAAPIEAPSAVGARSWWSEAESPKAWMSVRDADLLEALLHRLAVLAGGAPLDVVEWGAGRSTLWYTSFLATFGAPYRWLALEHDRTFAELQLADELARRTGAAVAPASAVAGARAAALRDHGGLLVAVFDAGELRPFEPGREADRLADLDDYVELPASLGFRCDLAIVDGRMRRRCLEGAAALIRDGGYAVLHDAWRTHYQCAWRSFRSGRRFGDEWWIGSPRDTDFEDVLPAHAFEDHVEPPASR